MFHEKHVLHWVLWGAVALGGIVACGAPSWDPPRRAYVDTRTGAEAAFDAHRNESFASDAAPERFSVVAVDPAGLPLSGVELACHDVRTRTSADGRAECDVRAADSSWPVYVRAKLGRAFGHTRAVGRGQEVRVVVRPTVELEGTVEGELPWTGKVVAIAESASGGEVRTEVRDRRFRFLDRAAVRTFIRIEHETSDGATTMLGAAISEEGEPATVSTGALGSIVFSAVDEAGVTVRPRVYVDRIARGSELDAGKLRVPLVPGEHVLVLNAVGSRAREEVKFRVEAGTVTELGQLVVK
jgi:hypothetical protein